MGMGNTGLGRRGGKPTSRRRRLLALAAPLGIAVVAAALVATAGAVTIGGYDIDGTVPDAGTTSFSDPVGSVKELGPENGSHTKVGAIDNAALPMLGFTDVNGGVDLSGMWLDTNVDSSGDVWLYFAWKREAATTGFVAFEFQKSLQPAACDYDGLTQVEQSPLTAAQQAFIAGCNPWANRQAGDFMVVWDLQGNNTDLQLRTYGGSSFGAPVDLGANAEAAFGTGQLTGEAAINLSKAGIFPANPTTCLTFANVIAATVTGNADTADFKDTILADTSGVGISNCGQVRVTKDTNPEGQTGTFPYALSRADTSALRFDGATSVTGTLTSDGDSDLVSDLKVGTNYTLAEGTLAAEWALASISCVKGATTYDVVPGGQQFTVEAGVTTECTITNELKPRLTVNKVVVGGGAGDLFDLKIDGVTKANDVGNGGTTGAQILTAGSHTVSETLGNGNPVPAAQWDVAISGDCAADGTVSLAVGDNKTCTITNTKRGTIVIEKQTNPDGSTQSFGFTGEIAASLTDGQTSSKSVSPGTYTVTETELSGWDLTRLSCDDGDSSGSVGTRTATFVVGAGETVKCTFTNTQDANIVVEKQTNPDGDTQSFAFTASYDGDGFSLADGQQNDSGDLDPGTYSVAETVPSGWDLESAVCSDGSPAGAVSLQAGETVTCVFTNEKDAKVVVVKQTQPDGATESFEFDPSWGPNFNLTDGQQHDSGDLDPGTYSVSELTPIGWDLTSATCSDESAPGSILLQAGETVTCTFVNTKRGAIVVEKQTNPDGSAATFDFTGDLAGTIGDGGELSVGVEPGTYTVTEAVKSGWDLTELVCDDGDSSGSVGTRTATFVVGAGETVKCTFTNTQDANIVVEKQTNPDGDPATFEFDTDYSANFELSDGQQNDSGDLDPGTYSVSELAESGWDLESAVCSDGSPAGAISLQAGETVTCVFTNEKDANVVVEKETLPNGAEQSFTFDPSWGADFALADGGAHDSGDLDPGTYSVSETVPAGWEQVSVVCSDGSAPGAISLQAGETVTCTFTNGLRPTLRVEKVVVGGDGEQFDLRVDGELWLDDAGDGEGRTDDVDPGDYTVSELNADGTAVDPAVWDTTVVCDGQETASVSLDYGDDATCTITNAKRPTLTVTKVVVGGKQGDAFDVMVNGAAVLEDTAGGSHTGDYAPGDYSVTETEADGGAVSSDEWDVVYSGDCDADGDVALAYGDAKTCTITNSKRPKLTVVKEIVGGGEGDLFDLSVSGTTVIDNGGDGASHTDDYAPGAYTVAETEGDGGAVSADEWDVTYSESCPQGAVALAYGDEKTCTITNAKRPLVKVVKNLEPSNDGGRFDLTIGGTTYTNEGAGYGDGGETPFQDVDPGSITVSEAGHAPTKSSSYYNDVACDSGKGSADDADAHTFQVAYGDVVTCTFTNERKPSSIDVVKTADPTSVAEPGGTVTYTVTVENTSAVDVVTLTESSFVDKVKANGPADTGSVVAIADLDCNGPAEGDGFSEGAEEDAILLSPGETVTCTFTMDVEGNAGDVVNDRVTVTGTDEAGRDVSDYDEASVAVTNVPATIRIVKTASPTTVAEPGGSVTFTFVITNTSAVDPVTIQSLSDTIYGDLSTRGDCGGLIGDVLQAGGETTCSFSATVTGDAGDVETNVVTVTGVSDDGEPVTDTDDATVTVTDVAPTIVVEKTASPTAIAETNLGTEVTFTVEVTNTSVEPVTLTSLVDDVFGNLDGQGTCAVPQPLAKAGDEGDAYTCTFTKLLTGSSAGAPHHDTVTAKAVDDDENEATDTDDATVTFTDVPSSIVVTKTAGTTSVQAPGGNVTYTVVVQNTSAVDTVSISSLVDDRFGNLDGQGTCDVTPAKVLVPGASFTCTFVGAVSGAGDTQHVNVVTGSGTDDDGNPVSDADDAVVAITPAPPPPPPPYEPKIDVAVTKAATPQVTLPLGGGTASITYNLVVRNNGPDPATAVQVADPAPTGVTFVSATTSKGSCSTSAALLQCTIASLAAGESTAITVSARVSVTGTVTNVVTVTGSGGPDTNPANNTAQAQTLVVAPLAPPAPKPKPTPKVEICDTLTVTQKMLRGDGSRQPIVARVTEAGKPVANARVLIVGPGVRTTVRTNAKGVATVFLKPSRPGIIRLSIRNAKACNTQRIGVVGVFEPPVTG